MADFKCKLCQNVSNGTIVNIQEKMFGTKEAFDYLECGYCQSLQLLEIPEKMDHYYPNGYYSKKNLVLSSFLIRTFKKIRIRAFFILRWKFLAPLYGDWLLKLQVGPYHRIADIGCGEGQLLYELYACGYRNLKGFDPYLENDGRINPFLSLYRKQLDEIEGEFDIIMLHHSFEHMGEPLSVLKKINALLVKGGKLLIRVPVANQEAWHIYGTDWVQLDAPRHIFVPSIKAMKYLAQQTGFILQEIEFDSTVFQFLGSELYKKGNP